jgi:hypothetical protein
MKRIRYSLATIALLAVLSGLFPLGAERGSLANAASSVAGHSAKPVISLYKPPCPGAGVDC